eukprot:scaffold3886_cov399-Prasinococcus_capsulatus_cf.AAC.28
MKTRMISPRLGARSRAGRKKRWLQLGLQRGMRRRGLRACTKSCDSPPAEAAQPRQQRIGARRRGGGVPRLRRCTRARVCRARGATAACAPAVPLSAPGARQPELGRRAPANFQTRAAMHLTRGGRMFHASCARAQP